MADRTVLWGGRSASPRRAIEQGGRQPRHDEQRLLVELELDDSLYQGTLRSANEQETLRRDLDVFTDAMTYAADGRTSGSLYRDVVAEIRPRSQSKTPREAATKRQTQQRQDKRHSSPYKLKQQVLDTRLNPSSHSYQHQVSHNESVSFMPRGIRSSVMLQQSPAQLVIESTRQKIHLRDQVIAQLQHELMEISPLHRATRVEKTLSQRVMKLLNKMRSLSLSVVEAVVYLSGELGPGASSEHEILEQDFYRYLQQMASSDTDFLAYSPQLQRFFLDFDVVLTRNPFVDGLSLDSSEVLLCSSHQSAARHALFYSASSSSSSLMQLLTHKLETFALHTQRYFLGWQVLPAERVAAALLHLMDLENRFNAVQMLPRYLRTKSTKGNSVLHPDNASYDGDDNASQFARPDPQLSRTRRTDSTQSDAFEAWTSLPRPKVAETQAPLTQRLSSNGSNRSLSSISRKEETARMPSLPRARQAKASSNDGKESVDLSPVGALSLPSPSPTLSSKSSRIENQVVSPCSNCEPNGSTTAVATQDDEAFRPMEVARKHSAWSEQYDAPLLLCEAKVKVADNTRSSFSSSRKSSARGSQSSSDAIPDALPASAAVITDNHEPLCVELESRGDGDTQPASDDDDDCKFEYSSNEVLSSIAMALQLLPNFSLLSTNSRLDDDIAIPEESLVPIVSKTQDDETRVNEIAVVPLVAATPSIVASPPASPRTSAQSQVAVVIERASVEVESFEQRVETTTLEDDEYVYSSSTAVSNIAMALSLLPSGGRAASPRSDTSAATDNDVVDSLPTSSRSDTSVATNELSELTRIFTLCRDIQVAAYDMSHWVSQREIEAHIEATAQPFSSTSAYSSSTNNANKYLERELKMLRRNFAYWKEACAEQKRARVAVRRLLATLKVRDFVLYQRNRQVRARIEEEKRRQVLAASRLQEMWRSYCERQEVAKRKAGFRAVHLAFHRTRFFRGISRRRRLREDAKETIVRWWRRRRLQVKRAKLRQKKFVRERQRRARALREIGKFLKEVLLRRKLKAVEQWTREILYKEQLKWTKARQDAEKSREVNAAQRRELIDDMNARLTELDLRWRASERERLELLTHHERIVHQQQHSVEIRRRRLATLKIQMFFKVCLLHRKLQKVESEKNKFAIKLEDEILTKKKLRLEAHKRIDATRTQVRVLERKLDRMTQQALATDCQHRDIVHGYQERVNVLRELAARQKIKAFVDARVVRQRADNERRKLLQDQMRLLAEKTETEFMSSEDALEQRREARSTALTLHQRLFTLESHAEELLVAKTRLAVEKEQEAQRALETLKQNRIEASMNRIAFWVSGHIHLSKLEKDKEAIRVAAAQALEEEKQRQRLEYETKTREVSSIKVSAYMRHRLNQHLNWKTLETVRKQHQLESAQERAVAGRTRVQLVQLIIDVKLLTERECDRGIGRGLDGVAKFHQAQKHKLTRLKCLLSVRCARTIQRVWRRRRHEENVKRAQEEALAQVKEAARRQEAAQTLQLWRRREVQDQQRRREHQVHFNARLETIRARANVRRIQSAWRRRIQRENERRQQQQRLAFEMRLEAVRQRAYGRRIQGAWRRRVQRERERRDEQQTAFDARLRAVRVRANARKLQSVWRQWTKRKQDEREKRRLDELELSCALCIERRWRTWRQEQQTKALRHASAQVVQQAWKRWHQWRCAQIEKERARVLQQEVCEVERQKGLAAQRIQGNWRQWRHCKERLRARKRMEEDERMAAVALQRTWKKWQCKQLRVKESEREKESKHLLSVRCARTIQRVWRRRRHEENVKRAQEEARAQVKEAARRQEAAQTLQLWRRREVQDQRRRREHQVRFNARLETIRARANVRRIQSAWRRRIQRESERRQQQQRLAFEMRLEAVRQRAHGRRIQGAWRRRVQRERERRDEQQAAFDARLRAVRVRANARKLQSVWRQWTKRKQDEREKRRLDELELSCALCIERRWRTWRQEQQTKALRHASAQVVQQAWKRWHQWRCAQIEKERARVLQQEVCEVERQKGLAAQRIQGNWRQWRHCKERLRARKRMEEDERMAAVALQRTWKKWQCEQCRVKESEREKESKCQQQQHDCASIIQQMWRRWRVDLREHRKEECLEVGMDHMRELRDEELEHEKTRNALKIQILWRKMQRRRREKVEKKRLAISWIACALQAQRSSRRRRHGYKVAREQVEHEAALQIQALWLQWSREKRERDRICQERHESSLKLQRNWTILHRRRKAVQERRRHKQNVKALKIQKCWRRWRCLALEQRNRRNDQDIARSKPGFSEVAAELGLAAEVYQREERQEKLAMITQRSSGRCIMRAVKQHLRSRREKSAATKIEAAWRGKLHRTQYLNAFDAKRAEEAREVSELATKVQLCWHKGERQLDGAITKDGDLDRIQEAQAIERVMAAKRIQRFVASRRRVIAAINASSTLEPIVEVSEEELKDQRQHEDAQEEDVQEPSGVSIIQSIDEVTQAATSEDLTPAIVETSVANWEHRELPHIFTHSINQVVLNHGAAHVLQRSIREYRRRRQMHFYFQRPFLATSPHEPGATDVERFHLYFKRARGWLDWDSSNSMIQVAKRKQSPRLRLGSKTTRKLLQLFEQSEEHSTSEIHEVFQEIAADTLPIFQSLVCWNDNDNVISALRCHDVEEMELSRSVQLLQRMKQIRAQSRRPRLETVFEKLSVSSPLSDVEFKSIEKSAPSSPSHQAKTEVTAFNTKDNAAFGALDPKTQRNALHMLSFSKENAQSRAEKLEFLLSCDAKLDVNAVDCNGDTPLLLYASLGHLSLMRKLLEHDADIQKTNNKGQNVLHRACEGAQVEVCGLLQQLMMKDSIAEYARPVETMSSLVPVALSLHTPDHEGQYPLHCLAGKGFTECAKQLLVPTKANDEWNRVLQAQGDSEGRTALHLAVLAHDEAMIAVLLTFGGGSNVNAFDKLHRAPLHFAVESPAALPIIAQLMQHGANVNVADERGDTPLHWAALSGYADVAQLLVTHGADPRLLNTDWETPAHIAAAYGQHDCMRLLLQAQRRDGADLTSGTKYLQQHEEGVNRPASERAVVEDEDHFIYSCHTRDEDTAGNIDEVSSKQAASLSEQTQGGYWAELHQDVQLVEESGQFSSEDEDTDFNF